MRDMRGAITRSAEGTLTAGELARLLSRQTASTHVYVELPDGTQAPISIATNPRDSDDLYVFLILASED